MSTNPSSSAEPDVVSLLQGMLEDVKAPRNVINMGSNTVRQPVMSKEKNNNLTGDLQQGGHGDNAFRRIEAEREAKFKELQQTNPISSAIRSKKLSQLRQGSSVDSALSDDDVGVPNAQQQTGRRPSLQEYHDQVDQFLKDIERPLPTASQPTCTSATLAKKGQMSCGSCDLAFLTTQGYLAHLHTAAHKWDRKEKPWRTATLNQYVERNGSKETQDGDKALEFIQPCLGFFCAVCGELFGDTEWTAAHVNSSGHIEAAKLKRLGQFRTVKGAEGQGGSAGREKSATDEKSKAERRLAAGLGSPEDVKMIQQYTAERVAVIAKQKREEDRRRAKRHPEDSVAGSSGSEGKRGRHDRSPSPVVHRNRYSRKRYGTDGQ